MHRNRQVVEDLRSRLDDKAEIKRKYELILKIYEEDRVNTIRDATMRYKAAGRAALASWLEYMTEPRPDPADLLRSIGFSPEVLGLESQEQ